MMQIWSRTEEGLTSGPGRPVRPIGPGGPFSDSWRKNTTGFVLALNMQQNGLQMVCNENVSSH